MNLKKSAIVVCAINLLCFACNKSDETLPLDNEPKVIADNLNFAEGPAFANDYLYFSDVVDDKIYRWSESTGVELFISNSGGANGLFFDAKGDLFICEGENKRLTCVAESSEILVIADAYNNIPFNEPNDLWISPKNDIYFSDPIFTGTKTQPGEYVYCVGATDRRVKVVCNNLVKPNGIVGSYDGSILFVADYGASKIFKYSIETDGTLSNQELFANIQADGLTIDEQGNLYAAGKTILVYNPQGELLKSIEVEGTLTNLFYNKNNDVRRLFVTTHCQVLMISL